MFGTNYTSFNINKTGESTKGIENEDKSKPSQNYHQT